MKIRSLSFLLVTQFGIRKKRLLSAPSFVYGFPANPFCFRTGNAQPVFRIIAFLTILVFVCVSTSEAATYGGGTSYPGMITDTNITIAVGTNSFNGGLNATTSGDNGGVILVSSGINTFSAGISAAGSNETTSLTGGQMTIVAGTNVFNSTGLTIQSGTGGSANGTLYINGGTNTFNDATTGGAATLVVGGAGTGTVNGIISVSGGTNVFNVPVTASAANGSSTSANGGVITVSGGTNTFNSAVSALNGTASNGAIYVSGGTAGVTLQSFSTSNFLTNPTYSGLINLVNMTVTGDIATTGTLNTYTNASLPGTMSFAEGTALSSSAGNININGGSMDASLSLSAPNGTVTIGGLTALATDTINITAQNLLLSGSAPAAMNLTSTTSVTVATPNSSLSSFGAMTATGTAPTLTVSGGNAFNGTLSGFSSLNVQSGANAFTQDLSLTQGATIASGTNTFSGTLTTGTASSGTLAISGGMNTFAGDVAATTGSVNISAGTNTFEQSVTTTAGLISVTGGTNSFGTETAAPTLPYVISAATGTTFSGGANTFNGVDVEGNLTFTGQSSISGNLTIAPGGPTTAPDLTISGQLTFVISPTQTESTPMIDASLAADINVTAGGSIAVNIDALPAGTTNANYVLIKDNDVGRGSEYIPLDGTVNTLMYQYSYDYKNYAYDADGVYYDPDSTVAPIALTDYGIVLNITQIKSAQTVAGELGGNAPAAYAMYPSQGTALFNVGSNQEAYNNVEAATGSTYANAASVQVQRLNYVNQMVMSNVVSMGSESLFALGPNCPGGVPAAIAPYGPGGTNIWLSGFGLGGNGETRNGINGCDFTTYGFLLGLDVDADEGCRLGMFYGYSQNDINSFSTSMQSSDHTFGFYGKWQSIWLYGYSALLFDFSFNKYDGNRYWNSAYHLSNFDGRMAGLYYEKGWDWYCFENCQVNPYLGIQYIYDTSDSFSDGALNVGKISYSDTRGIVGVRVKQTWQKCVWEEKIAYHQRFRNDNPDFMANYAGTQALIYGNAEGNAWAEFNFKIKYPLDKSVILYGNYFLMVNSYSSINAGMGTLEIKF